MKEKSQNVNSNSSRWALLLLGVSLISGTGCKKPPAERSPQKFVVGTRAAVALTSAGLAQSSPEYIAVIRANEETDFSFKVGGIIESVGPDASRGWDEGSPVVAGSVLARLKQSDFKNALAAAKSSAGLATINLERLTKLLAGGAASKQEADKAKADAELTNAQLEQATQNLRDSELRAPWDGVVFTRHVNPGETVAAGKPIVRFGDIRTMSVELGVPDRLIGRFAVGNEIDVDVSALAGRPAFRGRISEAGIAADKEGRLYRVVIKVPNPDGILKSGMTAAVRAGDLSEAVPNQVVVPLSALVAPPTSPAEGKPTTELAVFVVQNGTASRRVVQTGDILASSILVTGGLAVGETVVIKGASQLYDGAPVIIR